MSCSRRTPTTGIQGWMRSKHQRPLLSSGLSYAYNPVIASERYLDKQASTRFTRVWQCCGAQALSCFGSFVWDHPAKEKTEKLHCGNAQTPTALQQPDSEGPTGKATWWVHHGEAHQGRQCMPSFIRSSLVSWHRNQTDPTVYYGNFTLVVCSLIGHRVMAAETLLECDHSLKIHARLPWSCASVSRSSNLISTKTWTRVWVDSRTIEVYHCSSTQRSIIQDMPQVSWLY